MAGTATNSTSNENDTADMLKQLEKKMSGIMGVVESLSKKVDEEHEMFVSPDSAYFLNMTESLSISLHEAEADRRLYEEAMEQNAKARELSGAQPRRGDPDFWQKAFAPTPLTPVEVQATAMKSALGSQGVMDSLKSVIGGGNADNSGLRETINAALKSKADDRTIGEKVLDKIGLGGITKMSDWFADRNIRKEEKATQKDQGTIKREQKELNRLSAKYRKMKADGASDEELDRLRQQYEEHRAAQEKAAARIQERQYDDLFEMSSPMGNGLARPSDGKANPAASPSSPKVPEDVVKILMGMSSKMATDTTSDLTGAGRTATGGKFDDDERRTGDTAGKQDEMANQDAGKADGEGTMDKIATFIGDPREAHDIQRNLDTRLRPDFYREGTEFFRRSLRGELSMGAKESTVGSKIGKVGMYAAAAAAVAASAAKIGQAAVLVKDWYDSSKEAVENIKTMTEQAVSELEKRKNGVNDSMLAATQESVQADQELHASEQSWADSVGDAAMNYTPLGWLARKVGFKSDRQKAREKAASAAARAKQEQESFVKMRKAAENAGVDTQNIDEFKKFKALYDKGQSEQYRPPAKLAAGNLADSGMPATAQTPGATTSPEKAETAEEQRRRIEEATYEGTKRALLDSDVQRQNEENAKIQGRQIDQSLNGRK